MLIPSHIAPDRQITLDDLSFKAGPRVMHHKTGGSGSTNSIELPEGTSKLVLEKWLKFHSFTTHSREPIHFYTHEGFPDKLEPIKGATYKGINFEEFTSRIYLWDTKPVQAIVDKSYSGLFQKYSLLKQSHLDLIDNFLIDLNDDFGRQDRILLDRSYLQIVKSYSIIDHIIGQPPFCPKKLDCTKCGATELMHHRVPARIWTKERLTEIMGDSSWLETYTQIIETSREKIRHPSVHTGKMPHATMPDHSGVEHVEYDLKKTVEDLKEDKHALKAFIGMLDSVTWFLLMNYVFDHGVFQRPTGYSVNYITVTMSEHSMQSLNSDE